MSLEIEPRTETEFLIDVELADKRLALYVWERVDRQNKPIIINAKTKIVSVVKCCSEDPRMKCAVENVAGISHDEAKRNIRQVLERVLKPLYNEVFFGVQKQERPNKEPT